MVAHFTLPVVQAYMKHVQDNAAESVRRVIDRLHDAPSHTRWIKASGSRSRSGRQGEARGDRRFSGTSPQQNTNFNAPDGHARGGALLFRVMVDDDIPMNAGCLRPINIIIPKIDPLAGISCGGRRRQCGTSQAVTDCLFGALGALAPPKAR